MKMPFKWEEIDGYHSRCKVLGGWLVKAYADVRSRVGDEHREGYEWRIAMTFVPDPRHKWEIGDSNE